MRKFAMSFSLFQCPRYRIHTLASSWWESLPNLTRRSGVTPSLKVLGSGNYRRQGRQYRRLSRQSITTKQEGIINGRLSCKTSIDNNFLDETESTKIKINESQVSEVERTKLYDVQRLIAENKDLAELVTFIVFDLETTGFCRRVDRIIEIGLQDLSGGKNSTFQALVNPQCSVPNSFIHGISSHMVNRPDVPRMEDLIPTILKYIESRQKPGGFVVLVAHNARTFDAPFLIQEFARCSSKIPSNCYFLDTRPLAREAMKSKGLKVTSKVSLQALGKFYGITSDGSAHRALSDVKMLSLVFQRITFDLKLRVSDLIEKHTFTDLDLENSKRKKNSR